MKITIKYLAIFLTTIASASLNAGPLHEAAAKGDLQEVIRLIKEEGANVNAKDNNNYGNSPLHIAALWSRLDIVTYLAEQGADINNAKNNDGSTPLHNAVISQKIEIIKYLVENGANIDTVTTYGATPALLTQNIDIKNYLTNAQNYYTNGTQVTQNLQNQDVIPNYFLLATIKKNFYDIKNLFSATQTPEELQGVINNIEYMQLKNNDNSGRKLAMSLCLNHPKSACCSLGKFGTSVKNQQNLLGFLKTQKDINASFKFN